MVSSTEYSCGFCLSEKEEMSDPRKLPCGHIFCLQCLMSDFQISHKVQCICCRREYEGLDLTTLANCSVGKNTSCDVCDIQATVLCTTCNKNMCKKHDEIHDNYHKEFRIIHKTELIPAEIAPTPEEPKCPAHMKEVIMACSVCLSLLCRKCLMEGKCGKDGGGRHEPVDVHEQSGSYKISLNDQMSKLWSRITEIEVLEKKAQALLSDENTKCDNMKKLIDEVLHEQHELMTEKAGEIKLAIDSHKTACDNQVSKYIASVFTTKDVIDEVRKEIHELKQQSDYDIFLRRNAMEEKSGQLLALETDNLQLADMDIYRFAQKDEIEKELETPKFLKIQFELEKTGLEGKLIQLEEQRAHFAEAASRSENEKSELKVKYEKEKEGLLAMLASQLEKPKDESKVQE